MLMVPGIGGSGPEHWQSLWEHKYSDRCTRFQPSSWSDPDPRDWQQAITTSLAELGPNTLIVAHSLGCLAVAELAQRPVACAAAVLVAPPDVAGPVFPAAAASFIGIGTARMTIPTLVLSSADDPYCSPAKAAELARRWGAELINVGAVGHINAASTVGEWPLGWYLAHGFASTARRDPDGTPPPPSSRDSAYDAAKTTSSSTAEARTVSTSSASVAKCR